jgi:pyruvate dehydrogenase E2 component (dihydrolipoamide acetyltransferase)
MPTPMRQAIARHMTYSKQNIPHYYLTMRAEISALLDRREAWNDGRDKAHTVSINDLLVKAVALALVEHPQFNGYYQDSDLRPQQQVNIGIAIDLPDGLIAPAILAADALPLDALMQRRRDLAARAQEGKLRAEEYTAATFTISNLGMFDVDSFIAIIVPPQVGILAVGAAHPVTALQGGELVVERRMALTLSGDHRATDGAEGARFLKTITDLLQQPDRIFV